MHVASNERSCETANLYRLDLAFAARMHVSSFDLNCLVHKDSFSILHLLLRFKLIVTADNTQNDYVAEGTSLKTILNRCGYTVALTLYA